MTSKLRLAAAGVAVLAGIGLLTACIQAPPTTDTTPSPSASASGKPALEVLHDALAKADGQPYSYTLTYGTLISASGYRDATGASADRNVSLSGQKGEVIYSASTVYAKIDLGALALFNTCAASVSNQWITLSQSSLGGHPVTAAVLPVGESFTLKSFIDGVVTADYAPPASASPSATASASAAGQLAQDATTITGTIDLSKSSPLPVPASEIALLGDKKIVPFTATVGADGYVSSVSVSVPAIESIPAATVTTTFTNYGTTQTVTAPTGAVAAPDCVFTILP